MEEMKINQDAVREVLKSRIEMLNVLDLDTDTEDKMKHVIVMLGIFMETLTSYMEARGDVAYDKETVYDQMEDCLVSFRPTISSAKNDELMFELVTLAFTWWIDQLNLPTIYSELTTEQVEDAEVEDGE